jgi:hypothetical protein
MKKARKILVLVLTSLFIAEILPVVFVHAAVTDWQKGATIVPTTQSDFASDSFKQSLQNLKATGANYVSLVVPYYQSTIYSTDVGLGWNTPTDAALASAIDYAHSLGLKVSLNMHVDPYTGEWRAYINPTDRTGWFNNYGNYLVHTAQLGQSHNAEMLVIGTELVSMSSSQINSSNTQNWISLINKVRNVYKGKLTYSANSDNNNNDTFENEKKYVGFWSNLDYAGLSVYYNLNSPDNSVGSLKSAWDYWNQSDLKNFAQQTGKQLLFVEVGYRSLTNAHVDPWNWSRQGSVDYTEQSNDYEALMSYWNNYSYIAGVYWWNWESDPNAGGNNTTYTVQNKPALSVLTKWFTSSAPPTTTPPPGSGQTADVWWPVNNAHVSGLQPFKAMLENLSVNQYQMYWQVDGGQLNLMSNSSQDYPHKEALVDLSGWRWNGDGPYLVNFVSKNSNGTIISQKSVIIYIP